VVYLVAFNTVLRDVDIWYFGFVLLVAVLNAHWYEQEAAWEKREAGKKTAAPPASPGK
jgi:hypothetical protein